jgi:hypothetical protein
MKRRIFVCVAFVGLVASLHSGIASAEVKATKEMLVGTWDGKVEIDEDALKADERIKKIPADRVDFVVQVIKDQLSKTSMQISFAEDGKAMRELSGPGIPPKERSRACTWTIDGATVTVKLAPEEAKGGSDGEKKNGEKKDGTKNDGKKAARDMVFTVADERTMTVAVPAKDGNTWPNGVVFKFTKK